MRLCAGTSGFAYKEWKGEGRFYPAALPARDMLRYYASQLAAVEINNTFYRMPSSALLEGWHEQVPADFRFALKAPRRITHTARLEGVGDSVARLFDTAEALGEKLGPLLFQLPPYLRRDDERLRVFLDGLPAGRRVAVEFRHRSWLTDAVFDALRARNAALCVTDGEVEGGVPLVATSDWGYLRLRKPGYDDARLAAWAGSVRGQPWTDAFVFFKHEDDAEGPGLARRFAELFAA